MKNLLFVLSLFCLGMVGIVQANWWDRDLSTASLAVNSTVTAPVTGVIENPEKSHVVTTPVVVCHHQWEKSEYYLFQEKKSYFSSYGKDEVSMTSMAHVEVCAHCGLLRINPKELAKK